MTRPGEIVQVAVISEDGRHSDIGTFHGWQQREDGWWADVMVYGPRRPNSGTGMYRDTLPADRVLPLKICGRLPSGEILHGDECRPAPSVMLPT